jgi:DnaJ-class molecular chaperone
MSPMSHDPFGAVLQGMRWCPDCNGDGSSLREDAERCTHCAGTGLPVDEAAALSAECGRERFDRGRRAARRLR